MPIYEIGHRERVCNFISKEAYSNDWKVVEVGVNSGSLSRQIWALPEVGKLYLVDPWSLEFPNVYFKKDAEIEACYQAVQKEADKQGGKVEVIRKPSLKAAKRFEDGSLDFVFLDGLHDFGNVQADIKAWLPKIRKGGILAGDDYHLDKGKRYGVRRAVCTEFQPEELQFIVDRNGKPRVWWVRVK
jgi:hypothetical protein